MTSFSRRKAAAARYKPKSIELLLIAEAPPCTLAHYFYFEKVDAHDWLFRYVWEGLTHLKPERSHKRQHLTSLHDAGIFLIDLHEDSISKPSLPTLCAQVPGLVERAKRCKPRHIILIKSSVYDAAFAALFAMGQPVIDARIPFPASGQQKNFLSSFRRALTAAGFDGRTLISADRSDKKLTGARTQRAPHPGSRA